MLIIVGISSGYQAYGTANNNFQHFAAVYPNSIFYKYSIIIILLVLILAVCIYREIKHNKRNKKLQSVLREKSQELSRFSKQASKYEDTSAQQKEKIQTLSQELETHRNDLENMIKEKSKALLIAKQNAEESDRLKTAFLANMSHEIRTPLNAMIGFSSLLIEDDIPREIRESYIDNINNSSDMLLKLIEDLLVISKLESGDLKIILQETDIRPMMLNMHTVFKHELSQQDKQNVEIKIKDKNFNEDHIITTDPIRLKQVLTKLLSNAVKYTDEGWIEFGYDFPDKNNIQFYVRDTGIGINKEKINYIFDRFRKVESNKTKIYQGAGIGLSIAKRLVELMNGEIWVESGPGKGSTFYFTLPIDKETLESGTQAETEDLSFNWKNKTIMVVEDEASNYQYLAAALRKTEANIVWAKNGLDAENKYLANKQIDLILMDIKLPVVNGIIATKKLLKINKNLKIIAQTAYGSTQDMEESLDAGCVDYIAKPYKAKEILVKINNWMKD